MPQIMLFEGGLLKNMPECKVLQAEATYFAWIDLRALDIRPAQLTYLLEQETQIVVENGFRLGKAVQVLSVLTWQLPRKICRKEQNV